VISRFAVRPSANSSLHFGVVALAPQCAGQDRRNCASAIPTLKELGCSTSSGSWHDRAATQSARPSEGVASPSVGCTNEERNLVVELRSANVRAMQEIERVTAVRTCDGTLNQAECPERFRTAYFRRMGAQNRAIPTVRFRPMPQCTVWTLMTLID
jgi:hypothetical protein